MDMRRGYHSDVRVRQSGSYESGFHGDRYVPQSTPTKRKYVNTGEDYDSLLDDGYFSHSSPVSHSHMCDRNNYRGDICDSVIRNERHHYRGCCRSARDDVVYIPKHTPEYSGLSYQDMEIPVTHLQSLYESTPIKKTPSLSRRCFTDTKDLESTYDGHHQRTYRSQTCVKSRKRLNFQDTYSDCYHELPNYRPRATRNLQHELNVMDNEMAVSSNNYTGNMNTNGDRRQPCSTPVSGTCPSGYQSDVHCFRSPLKRTKPDVSPPRYQMTYTKSQCKCSDLQKGLLKLASSAFSNIRRKAASPESFEQFKTELDLTNQFLQQTLDMIKRIKEVCGH